MMWEVIATVGAALVGWIVYQVRSSADAEQARAHELAMARQANEAKLTEAAERQSMTELKYAEIRLKEAEQLLRSFSSDSRSVEVYVRKYLNGAEVFGEPTPAPAGKRPR